MAAPDNQTVTKKRDIALNRMKSKYPEKNFEDEEDFFGQINDDYDEYDKQIADRDSQIEEYKGREKTFSNMFSADPRSAAFLQAWRDGEDPAMALVRKFGPELEDILHDETKQEAIAAANKEYAERVAKEKQYEEEYQKNLQESLDNIEAIEKSGTSSEDIDAAFGLLLGIVRDGLVGKFSPESIEMALKALKHDADVETAGQDGEVRGRNAKIDEQLRKSKKGDGTEPLGGKNGAPEPKREKPNLGALDRFDDDTQTIWERGKEKRTKY